mmetsp:Transcript_60427/g.174342  ORF Transcript_60427/g.174342 Transcript_60427/m.174342 type:complete len:1086 (-) Transcript_60427:65-3322(-)
MALVKIATLFANAVFEAASLAWMELAMFGVAAVCYVFFVGGLPGWKPGVARKTIGQSKGDASEDAVTEESSAAPAGGGGSAEAHRVLRENAGKGDHEGVVAAWEQVKSAAAKEGSAPPRLDLAIVVDAMRKLGSSAADVATELRAAVATAPSLLDGVAALPAALLRDDAVELLDATLALLQEQGRTADPAAYVGLMAAQLRRKDFLGVANTAARLPSEALTPRMRAILAAAASQRGRLDEALGHLRQMAAPMDAEAKSPLPPSAAAQVLTLAAREQRVLAAAQELQRLRARPEAKHLEEILTGEGRQAGAATCRELLDAGAALEVPLGPRAYQVLAGALTAAADTDGLRDLFAELEAPGAVTVSEGLAMALLDGCRAVVDGDLAEKAFELARAPGTTPSGKLLGSTCSTLVACDRAERACDFCEAEMLPRGCWPDASLSGALSKAAAKLGRSELAQRLSEHCTTGRSGSGQGGGSSELQRQATLIKGHAKERNLSAAAAVFGKLRESGVQLTPLIFNCFLDACVQCGDVERATAHFEEMKQLNLIDIVGYNTMLKMHLSRGHTDQARALVKEMGSRGLQANKVTFNELLHSKVIAKDRRGMWSVLEEMQGAGVKPNSVTCSILLKSLSVHSDPEDVRRVVALIEDIEEAIDEVLFSSVIEACIRIKQLDLLSDLMRRYRHKGSFVNLSAPTYGSMIKAYGQAGDALRVSELWHEMEEHGVKPTSITLGCMVEALVVNNQADEAWELIHKELEDEERRGCINTVIYSTVLKGFAVTKRIDKVFVCYKEMRSKGIPCNTITYNTMLDACAKSCAMARAAQLLEDMAECGVEPDIITYSTIVKGYCVEGDVDRAFHVLEEMKSDGKFAPDEIMYNSILDGCAKQHRVDDALKTLEEMKNAGVAPSNYTLSILVKLLGHARRLNQAFRMTEELSAAHNFRPNVQVYTCLVQACVLNRKLDRAIALHDTMVSDAGCWTDDKFYAVLARGCLQMHQPLKAAEVVRAAYQLPGHSLAQPARHNSRPVGMEWRALEEVASRLQGGSKDEQEALAKLSDDLMEYRGLRMSDGSSGGGRDARRRRGGGGGGGARR